VSTHGRISSDTASLDLEFPSHPSPQACQPHQSCNSEKGPRTAHTVSTLLKNRKNRSVVNFFLLLLFRGRVWLHNSGWPQICNPPAFASQVLGLKTCTTTPDRSLVILKTTWIHVIRASPPGAGSPIVVGMSEVSSLGALSSFLSAQSSLQHDSWFPKGKEETSRPIKTG
jgi:hypothetical protein